MDQTADRRPVSAKARVLSKALQRDTYQTGVFLSALLHNCFILIN